MAPTWATLGTSGSFPSCFQQVGSFPECPKKAWQSQESEVMRPLSLLKLKPCFPIFLNLKFSHFPLSGKFWNATFCSNSVQKHTGIHVSLSTALRHKTSESHLVRLSSVPLKITPSSLWWNHKSKCVPLLYIQSNTRCLNILIIFNTQISVQKFCFTVLRELLSFIQMLILECWKDTSCINKSIYGYSLLLGVHLGVGE